MQYMTRRSELEATSLKQDTLTYTSTCKAVPRYDNLLYAYTCKLPVVVFGHNVHVCMHLYCNMGFKLKHTFPVGVHALHCIGVLTLVIIQQQLLLYRCIVYVVSS